MNKNQARAQYIAWIAREHPRLYQRVVSVAEKKSLERGLSGLGDLSGWLDTLVGAAVTVGGTLIAKKQADQAASLQKKQQAADLQLALLSVNTQRAQAGMPPVDINGNVIPSQSLPLPSSIRTTETAASMTSAAPNYLPWVAGGALALVGVVMVTRGK